MTNLVKALPRSLRFALPVAAVLMFYATASLLNGKVAKSPDKPAALTAGKASSEAERFAVVINLPDGPPRVDLGLRDANGHAVTAACSTCHTRQRPDHQNRKAGDLTDFHQGLTLAHGKVTCLSCHNARDYDTLTLADGSSVAFRDVMELCAQCHGPQTRDYEHGAHGGMTGYWDLSRGPRQRNNCVDCHDPHAPAFPKMDPTFKPRDRFLEGPPHTE